MVKKIIAVMNHKGGVGKTTTALALGAGLTSRGHKTLCIDLDSQANLTKSLGADYTGNTERSAFEVLMGKIPAESAIQRTEQCDVIGSAPALGGAETVMTSIGRAFNLKKAIAGLHDAYDYIIIDTPPSLGVLTVNALTACSDVLIPAQADIFSFYGIEQISEIIKQVREYSNSSINIMGILLTRYNSKTNISRAITDMIQDACAELQTKVYKATIREATVLKEAQAVKKSIFSYAPKSNASVDYTELLDEIIEE